MPKCQSRGGCVVYAFTTFIQTLFLVNKHPEKPYLVCWASVMWRVSFTFQRSSGNISITAQTSLTSSLSDVTAAWISKSTSIFLESQSHKQQSLCSSVHTAPCPLPLPLQDTAHLSSPSLPDFISLPPFLLPFLPLGTPFFSSCLSFSLCHSGASPHTLLFYSLFSFFSPPSFLKQNQPTNQPTKLLTLEPR